MAAEFAKNFALMMESKNGEGFDAFTKGVKEVIYILLLLYLLYYHLTIFYVQVEIT